MKFKTSVQLQALIISGMDYNNVLFYIIYLSLSDKPSIMSAGMSCTSGNTQSQNGIQNTHFVQAALPRSLSFRTQNKILFHTLKY